MQSHAKALRNQVAETSRSCSFPPSPPTPLHPRRGDQGSSTAIFGQRFVRGGVHAQTPTFKRVGNQRPRKRVDAACVHFEGWPGTENFTPLKTRPHADVEGQFEGWRLTVNSTTSNTRPHRAVELPFLARRGERGVGGESGGCSARIATFLVAPCAGTARASGLKVIQRPCGTRLQKFQCLVHSPLSTPAGGIRGAQQPYLANALSGVAFTHRRQHSNLPGTA